MEEVNSKKWSSLAGKNEAHSLTGKNGGGEFEKMDLTRRKQGGRRQSDRSMREMVEECIIEISN